MEISFKLFKTYPQPYLANLDLAKLKDEGIDAYATDKTMGSYGFDSVAVGGVKIFVAEKDIERAKEVLADS